MTGLEEEKILALGHEKFYAAERPIRINLGGRGVSRVESLEHRGLEYRQI